MTTFIIEWSTLYVNLGGCTLLGNNKSYRIEMEMLMFSFR